MLSISGIFNIIYVGIYNGIYNVQYYRMHNVFTIFYYLSINIASNAGFRNVLCRGSGPILRSLAMAIIFQFHVIIIY